MAHFRSFHRLYIAFSEILTEDDGTYDFYETRMRHNMAIPLSVPKACGYNDVVAELANDDDYFREHLNRVSRHVFELLLEQVEPQIISDHAGGYDPIPPDKQLSIFL